MNSPEDLADPPAGPYSSFLIQDTYLRLAFRKGRSWLDRSRLDLNLYFLLAKIP